MRAIGPLEAREAVDFSNPFGEEPEPQPAKAKQPASLDQDGFEPFPETTRPAAPATPK